MPELTDLAAAIRENRKRLGMTQHELAARARVSRPLIAKLEAGDLAELGVGRLTRILHAVGLDLRMTTLNKKRPTFEDLIEEDEAER